MFTPTPFLYDPGLGCLVRRTAFIYPPFTRRTSRAGGSASGPSRRSVEVVTGTFLSDTILSFVGSSNEFSSMKSAVASSTALVKRRTGREAEDPVSVLISRHRGDYLTRR